MRDDFTPPDSPELLFIGGYADGQRISVPSNLNQVDISERVESKLIEGSAAFINHSYRRSRIESSVSTIEIFCYAGLSSADALELLIQNYKRRAND
jgi:hypothetical protein